MRIRLFCLTVVLAFIWSQAEGAEPDLKPRFKVPSQWSGAWEISSEANKLLGFATKEDRANAGFDHPRSFTLSFDKTPGESTRDKSIEGYEGTVFKEMLKQRVVATGLWKMKFDVDPGLEEECCFLTVKEGSTYLWKPADYVVVYGGKISLIEGVDRQHDLLVIDFNPQESKFPRHETVVYKRAVPQPVEKQKEERGNGS